MKGVPVVYVKTSGKSKGKVLVVDDETVIRGLVVNRLSDAGYECEEADSAEKALERVRASLPGLVLLDIKMPGKTGVELLPEIKAICPETAVIMMTAVTDTDMAIQCMKLGAYDYVTKPFSFDQLGYSVSGALERSMLERELAEYRKNLELKVQEQTQKIRQLFLGAMEALVFALEAKDSYTAGHSRRVADIAVNIGKEMRLSEAAQEDLRWAALLHDIGKIAVDQSIQDKHGSLTPSEYEHIAVHSEAGANIVRPLVNTNVVEAIKHHHNRYDGERPHQEVVDGEIPLLARIIALADAFDAMSSDRPYREALPKSNVIAEIRAGIGTQFDPNVVEAFLRTMSVG